MIHSPITNVSTTSVVRWMNVIRNASTDSQSRILESFWESQLTSKSWIIQQLKQANLLDDGNVYIFGGWYGVLGSMILDNFLNNTVYSVDIDVECVTIGSNMDPRVNFITADMETFDVYENVSLVINTSTEHVSQLTFDRWLRNVPSDIPIVLQGNNFFSCKEHIRCFDTLSLFLDNNPLSNIIYSGTLDCKQFKRYMVIGYK